MYEKLYNEIYLLPTSVSDTNFDLSTEVKGGWSPHVMMKTEYHSFYSLFPLWIDVSKRQLLSIINFLCTSKYEIVSEKKWRRKNIQRPTCLKVCAQMVHWLVWSHTSYYLRHPWSKGDTSHHKPITWHGTKLQPELYTKSYTTLRLVTPVSSLGIGPFNRLSLSRLQTK